MSDAPEFKPPRLKDGTPLDQAAADVTDALVVLGYKKATAVRLTKNVASNSASYDSVAAMLAAAVNSNKRGQAEDSSEEQSGGNQEVSEKAADKAARESDPPEPKKPGGKGLDNVQAKLDAVGTVEPTPFADGTNAAISLVRAVTDKSRRGEHLKNAAISFAGVIPYIGDLAKVSKYGIKADRQFEGGQRATALSGKAYKALGGNVADIFGGLLGGGSRKTTEAQPEADAGGGPPGPAMPTTPGAPPVPGAPQPPVTANHPWMPTTAGAPPVQQPVQSNTNAGATAGAGWIAPLQNRFTDLAGTVGKASVATIAAANSLSLLNRAAIEYHRNLSNYNGELASAFGRLEAGRMQRNIKEGGELAGPLSGLVDRQNELEAALQDFQSPFKQMSVDVQAGLTRLATLGVQIVDFIEPISEVYPLIRKKLEEWGVVGPSADPMAESTGWMKEQRDRANQAGKNPRKV